MTPTDINHNSELVAEDLEHQQLRVLALISAVAGVPGNAQRLDGLTKLAKLDFIARYPDLEPEVARALFGSDADEQSSHTATALTAAPMIRYRYGPWDDRYYPVLGALVGRGLVRFVKGKRGAVGMALTPLGKRLVKLLDSDITWSPVMARYREVAGRFGTQNGSSLKDAIYRALPYLASTPLGTELK